MAQVAVPGKMQEYISNIEFSLNFEDSRKSTKVKIGDIVMYDGVTAKHVNKLNGQEFVGRAVPLKSAVANNWLTLNVKGAKLEGPINVRSERVRENIVYKDPDYNPKTGGAFDKFLENDPDTFVAHHHKVIKEEDQVVRKTSFDGQTTAKVEKKTGKMEVSGDQVDVKTVSSTVSNSTSSAGTPKRAKMPVIQSDDGHADHVITKTMTIKTAAKAPEKPKNSFTVDGTTPNIPGDSTLAEVQRVVAPVKFDEAQDGRVVRKVGAPRMSEEPNEQEGIVLKKTAASTPKKTSGSTPVADLSGVNTQAEVDALEKGLDKKEVVNLETKNFLDMLPEDWSTLHWVKKEKFIMQINDVEFLKFIMKVETIKAVHGACRKRMVEIEKQSANG